jgi:hypothetical protein
VKLKNFEGAAIGSNNLAVIFKEKDLLESSIYY